MKPNKFSYDPYIIYCILDKNKWMIVCCYGGMILTFDWKNLKSFGSHYSQVIIV